MRKYRWIWLAGLAGGAAVIASLAGASETVSYSYDARGRLVKVVHTGTVNNGVVADYSYDNADSRQTVNVSGAPQ